MHLAFGSLSVEDYERGLTVMSAVIVFFGGWLATMMMIRMGATRRVTGQDIASLTYVLSTVMVFLAIALRLVLDWPREVYFVIVFVKMASVVAVTVWARRSMQFGEESET